MGRLGLEYDEAFDFIRQAQAFKYVEIEGLFSHFSTAEDNRLYTLYQINRFRKLLSKLSASGIRIKLAHICNSAGLINFKNAHFDMVRSGIGLYGFGN